MSTRGPVQGPCAILGREDTPGESSALLSAASWLVWAALYAWVPFAVARLLDDSDPDKLIAVGAALWMASFAADAVMQWLKQVGSRPRPKYLLTLEDPASQFRNWWQMIRNDQDYVGWAALLREGWPVKNNKRTPEIPTAGRFSGVLL